MSDNGAIAGWTLLEEWLGHSPSFHDSEVVSIDLRREPELTEVRVAFWRTNEDLDPDGTFRRDRHAHAVFSIKGIKSLRLEGWNHQNVLSELWVERSENSFVLHMPEIYGFDGQIEAAEISVRVEPIPGA